MDGNHDKDITYDISPSDLNQSIVRVIFVTCVVGWSVVSSGADSITEALRFGYFVLSVSYWLFSLIFLAWTYNVLRKISANSAITKITRAVGIIADLGAISTYTAISGQYGVILYPIYLTCIIGYGYRFGLKYLYLSILVGTAFFSISLSVNHDISDKKSLVFAYYLGLLLVPIYSAALLKKHREILDRLKDVNEARTRFIANMSHELRTPLHAIISLTDLLGEEIDPSTRQKADQHAKLTMIGESAQHLLSLVNRVLDIASAEAGRGISADFENVNFFELFLSALRICEPKAVEKNISLYWYIDPKVPEYIFSSADHLQEVLINTVGNAVKYTSSGYVCVRATTKKLNGKTFLSINVVDTGIGISEKLLPTIFEPFTLGDDSAARKYSGTGLGLTITKQYIEYLRGEITYDSTENVGTRCSMLFEISERYTYDSITRVEPMSGILITPNALSPLEIEVLEHAGWSFTITSHSTFEDSDSDRPRVIFIDDSFGEHHDVVMSKVCKDYPSSIRFRYSSIQSHNHPIHLSYNGSVRRLNRSDCFMARKLAGAAVGESRKSVLGPGEREDISLNVLIADDNHANLKTAMLALESIGHTVTTVQSGEEALIELESDLYDVALVDMHMPGMSGIEAAKFYHFMMPEEATPIVVLTADATAEAKIAAAGAGAAAFLTKPLRVTEIREAVNRHSRRRVPELKNAATNMLSVDSKEGLPESLVDIRQLLELVELGVDRELIKEMVLEFEEDSKNLIDSSRSAARRNDLQSVKDYMHTLKGASATVGAILLQKRAEQIESRAWQCLNETAEGYFDNLVKLLNRSVATILAEIEGETLDRT